MEQTYKDALIQCPLFEGMSQKEIVFELGSIPYRIIRYARNDIYCLCGDDCRTVDIVTSGEMVVRMTGVSGRQVEVLRLRSGDIIAPCFIFSSDRLLPVEIVATENTQLLRMSPEALEHLIDMSSHIRHNFIRTLSDIGAYLATKIGFLTLKTVREKVVYLLRSEAIAQHSLKLTLSRSRQCIADSFAIQKFSLMRCLAELEEEGIIAVNGKEITILDARRLK